MPVNTKKSRRGSTLEPLEARTPGEVRFEKSFTRSIGDGNYLKVTASVTLPFYPTPAELDAAGAALDLAESLVEEKLVSALSEFVEE